jgi:hypothetical protein
MVRPRQEESFLKLTGYTDIISRLPNHNEQQNAEDGFFALPDLSFESQEILTTPSSTPPLADERDEIGRNDDEPVDVWSFAQEEPLKGANYLTWDAFEEQRGEPPHICYISEAGPEIFDAAVSGDSNLLHVDNRDSILVDTSIYAASLLALGLGRSSILFSWNEEDGTFEHTLKNIRTSGCSTELINEITAMFLKYGNVTKTLQIFADKAYSRNQSPGRIALADTIFTVLSTLQSYLNIPSTSLKSILHLKSLFEPVQTILSAFHAILETVESAKTDEIMLSQIYGFIEQMEHRTDSIQVVLLEVLSRVSRPFLDFTGEWIGLQREAVPLSKGGPGKSFIKAEDRSWIDEQGMEIHTPDFVLDRAMVPTFIPEDEVDIMFETGKSLRFLKEHHPDHPLSKTDIISSTAPPILEWEFSWRNIEAIEIKAKQYKEDLVAAIKKYSTSDSTAGIRLPVSSFDEPICELNVFGKPAEEMEAHLLRSIQAIDEPLWNDVPQDRLSELLKNMLAKSCSESNEGDEDFAPPISLVSYLSFSPIIVAQARIVNGTSMRLFFKSHHLREHLSLQRQFHLLGNGVFSSRLSHALFDPELETAERQAGVARSGGIMGLRLGGRDTWPPASSELRLALMGVLTESYTSSSPKEQQHHGSYLDRSSELPGDLSFGVRDMSEEEIEKCLDPNSVEALDFLRLSYKAPAPLEAVITPMCLYKYDQLFKLLLRVLRMLYVVNQLFRDATDRTSYWQGLDATAQRFRIESHHFISCISSYFFDTGIDVTWRVFEQKLDQVQARLESDDELGALSQHDGLDKLREYHERVLDRIMSALLLRKRQKPVMALLEEIFNLILRFSKYSRSRASGQTKRVGADAEVRDMYLRFRRKVEVFITVCRGMSEKKGYSEKASVARGSHVGGLFDGSELAEENTIVQLLARLEMSNYYSQSVKC